MDQNTSNPTRRIFTMLLIIGAAESIFLLPFVLARIFRPTFLEVFDLTNLQFGIAFSIYGVIAMVSYFVGGPLADRFPARKLMGAALISSSLGGMVLVNIPDLASLKILYAYWGLTTIFLFWAAMIRATREWGGQNNQGKAFGILDGGRGLFTAILSTITVSLFASMLPESIESASLAERTYALKGVMWVFTGLGMAVGILVWFFIPNSDLGVKAKKEGVFAPDKILRVMKMPKVWFQGIIIVCAYVGYKSTDDFSLFASDAFGYNDVQAANVATIAFWVRPASALLAGLLADRMSASYTVILGFAIMMLGSVAIYFYWLIPDIGIVPGLSLVVLFTVVVTSVGVNALRGVYYALLGEARIPMSVTGTAVGIVSVLGYTPDIFMGPLMGVILDNNPGALGHQYLFGVVAIFAFVGLIAGILFRLVKSPELSADT